MRDVAVAAVGHQGATDRAGAQVQVARGSAVRVGRHAQVAVHVHRAQVQAVGVRDRGGVARHIHRAGEVVARAAQVNVARAGIQRRRAGHRQRTIQTVRDVAVGTDDRQGTARTHISGHGQVAIERDIVRSCQRH